MKSEKIMLFTSIVLFIVSLSALYISYNSLNKANDIMNQNKKNMQELNKIFEFKDSGNE